MRFGTSYRHKRSRICLRLRNMINCKRCDLEITFDDSRRCLSYSTGMPHDIRKCNTKPGYVYCQECLDSFLKSNPCKHYQEYGYKPNEAERHFINLIREKYEVNSFLSRKWKKKTSHNPMKENQSCSHCGLKFPQNADRTKMDAHAKKCVLQMKLI